MLGCWGLGLQYIVFGGHNSTHKKSMHHFMGVIMRDVHICSLCTQYGEWFPFPYFSDRYALKTPTIYQAITMYQELFVFLEHFLCLEQYLVIYKH